MAIVDYPSYIAGARYDAEIVKTAAATTVAAQWHTLFNLAGSPGAGSLAVGNTANGLVPSSTDTGYPGLPTLAGGQLLYLESVDWGSTVAGRLRIYDRLFHAGSFSCAALTTFTLATIPVYSARLPNTWYGGLQIWVEINAAMAATATTIAVGYTAQGGTTGRSTGASASLSSFITGRLIRLPFQAGDYGVQQITSVVVGGATNASGTVNVFVARPLWTGRAKLVGDGEMHGPERLKMKQIFTGSALTAMMIPDSTSTGVPEMLMTVTAA